MMACALAVPAEDEDALGRGRQALAMRQRADVGQAAAGSRCDSTSVSSSSVMAITWSPLANVGVHRRIEEHVAVGAHHAHDRRVFVGGDHFAIRAAREAGSALK